MSSSSLQIGQKLDKLLKVAGCRILPLRNGSVSEPQCLLKDLFRRVRVHRSLVHLPYAFQGHCENNVSCGNDESRKLVIGEPTRSHPKCLDSLKDSCTGTSPCITAKRWSTDFFCATFAPNIRILYLGRRRGALRLARCNRLRHSASRRAP